MNEFLELLYVTGILEEESTEKSNNDYIQKGIRIQNVINELNGEKIDVIEWSPDTSTFLAAALLPAQIMAVDIKEDQ